MPLNFRFRDRVAEHPRKATVPQEATVPRAEAEGSGSGGVGKRRGREAEGSEPMVTEPIVTSGNQAASPPVNLRACTPSALSLPPLAERAHRGTN